jgi:hypothetical protein
MDVKQIEAAQRALSSDYKQLTKEFAKSRLNRADALLSKIDEIQQDLRRQGSICEQSLLENIPIIDQQYSVEQGGGASSKSSKRRKHSTEPISQPPPPSPPPEVVDPIKIHPLPIFQESFEQVLQPFRDSLNSVKKKYEFHSQLIESDAQRNVDLVWKQSTKDRIELRARSRKELTAQLHELDSDYLNVNKEEKLHQMEQRYRSSIRKVAERKARSDLTQIGELVKRRSDAAFNLDATNLSAASPLSSASQQEVDTDIYLMRQGNVKVERIEANYLYMEQPLKKDLSSGPTTMTDLVNSEIEAKGIAALQYPYSMPYQNGMIPAMPYNGQFPPPPPPPGIFNAIPFGYPPPRQQQQPPMGLPPSGAFKK